MWWTVLLLAALSLHASNAQQDFSTREIPNPFGVGDFYPARPEEDVCRSILDYIDRGSARFTNELVTNLNRDINFATDDSRLMTSRMQSRLDRLATLYYQRRSRRFTVLKAWTEFPDADLAGNNRSLHYEGRTVRVQLSRTSDISLFLTLAVEAAFDWVFYAASGYVRLSVIPSNCDRNVDLVFMLDQSGSVGVQNHGTAIQFISNIVSFFSIGLETTRVGFVAYSTNSHIEFDLDDHTTLLELQNEIESINYRGGWTATALALNDTRRLLNPSNSYGARPNSEGIPKIGVLITDGRANIYPLTYAAPALKAAGVQVYAVGIGNIDLNELRFISSDPDNEHVFLLRSFNDAAGFVDFLSIIACETPAIVDPGENTTTEVPEDRIQYFQTECEAFSDMVLVELTDRMGTSFLFCSASEQNPGPLTPNTITNKTEGVRIRTCIVRLPDPNFRVVYIGVQGQSMNNTFTLVVWDLLFEPSDVSIIIAEGVTGIVYDVTQNLTIPDNGRFRYSILEGNINSLFSINEQNGLLSLQRSLNFTIRQTYNLTIAIRNTSATCQRARIRINIRVVRNRIDFASLPERRVLETAPIGEDVVTVQAVGGVGSIQYSIVGGNTGGAFRIGASSGLIEVNAALQYEILNSYSLTIRATSIGTGISGTVTQSIIVTDVNESPFFVTACAQRGSCLYNIAENQQAGTSVGRIRADDPDLSNEANGMLQFSLTPPNSPFTVDSVGRINTAQILDREERNSYTLTLTVRDSCQPNCHLSIQTTVTIQVLDENDNRPFFIQGTNQLSVLESAPVNFVLFQYVAMDNDTGTNAEIEYTLTNNGNVPAPFAVDTQTGALSVISQLDFETITRYFITVTASNPDGLNRSVSTTINVLDANDNPPIFSPDIYTARITEHSEIGISVTMVTATDADSGLNGEIRYSIQGGNVQNSFNISETTGEIRVTANIDREQISSFRLVIRAVDLGSPRQDPDLATVSVTIIDINDNPPVFTPDTYSTDVREDLQSGFSILRVFAFDRDEPRNPNSEITYSVFSGNVGNVFQLDSGTGQLTLAASLDFENRSMYELSILATDGGSPSRSDNATVTIRVINVNENPPTFQSSSQRVNVSELTPVGSQITQFRALDPDQMSVSFTIDSGNEEGRFTIGNANGVITLLRLLDFETTVQYMLRISASDGVQSANATLTVNVLDENEHTPQFEGALYFSIPEEESGGTLVGQVSASDGDGSPDNSRITFSFVRQPRYFSINSETGEIRTSERLNREQLTQVFQPPQSTQTFEVSARDGGVPSLQNITSITIELADINDNSPQFENDFYNNSLLENLPAGTPVFRISATDSDLGVNAEIRYSFQLSSNLGDTVPFTIDNRTGLLETREPLDCELQQVYNFTIMATDLGAIPRNTSVQGVLMVLDENDNAPRFSRDVYEVIVRETIPVGLSLTHVSASDPDKGENGRVSYSIIGQARPLVTIENLNDDFTLFTINPTTGEIRHLTPFNFENQQQVNITVVASDNGVPRLSSSATVTFIVQNVDESRPIFPSTCNTVVPENLEAGTLLITCAASDPDNITTPENPIGVMYSITRGNDQGIFAINSTTAEITNTRMIDREAGRFPVSLYQLTIQARDLGNNIASREVNIRIQDINDNAPQFQRTPYQFSLTNDQIRRYVQNFITVEATDPDAQENGTFEFSVGSVNRTNDVETILTILATDNGSPRQTSSANVTVRYESPCQLQRYSIHPTSGIISANVLCEVTLRPSDDVSVTFGEDHTYYCRIVRNSPPTYQLVHNGSIVTRLVTLPQSMDEASLVVSQATFEDAGEYACKVTTAAGSIQTSTSTAIIQVAPTITVPPNNVAAQVGQSATFSCFAVGIPRPIIRWVHRGQEVGGGSTLVISDVNEGDRGRYTCRVNNSAGVAMATASLTVFEPTNIVVVTVDDLNNPSNDGMPCQFFDRQSFQNVLDRLTGRRTMITRLSGGAICQETACVPNPCRNQGTCELNENVTGGFECLCRRGYTGARCGEDVDECQEDPCSSGGTCINTNGTYSCRCPSTRSGHRCQYNEACNNATTCPGGNLCIQTLSSPSGYICRAVQQLRTNSLRVRGLRVSDPGFLDDIIVAYIERLQQQSDRNGRRGRRQTNQELITTCEPRFVSLDDGYVLAWVCPAGMSSPSESAQAAFCDVLFNEGAIASCQPPNGDVIEPPTTPAPTPEARVTISFIQVDNNATSPIDAADVLNNLQQNNAQEELARTAGLQVDDFSAMVPITCTPQCVNGNCTRRDVCTCFTGWNGAACDQNNQPIRGDNVGIIVGAAFGAVVGVVIIIIATILTICCCMRYTDHRKKQQEKRKRAEEELNTIETTGSGSVSVELPALNSTHSLSKLMEKEDNDYDELPPLVPPKPAEQPAQKEEHRKTVYENVHRDEI